jgi:hypothetical protein
MATKKEIKEQLHNGKQKNEHLEYELFRLQEELQTEKKMQKQD